MRRLLLVSLLLAGCGETGPLPEAISASCTAFESAVRTAHDAAESEDFAALEAQLPRVDSLFNAYASFNGEMYSPVGDAYSQVMSIRYSAPRLQDARQRPLTSGSGEFVEIMEHAYWFDVTAMGLNLQTAERARYCARIADR